MPTQAPKPLPPLPTSIVLEVENLYGDLSQYLDRCTGGTWNSFTINVARAIPILRSFLTESFEKQAAYYVTLKSCCPKWMEELGGQVQRAAVSHLEALGIARDLDAQELQSVVMVTVSACVEEWSEKIRTALAEKPPLDQIEREIPRAMPKGTEFAHRAQWLRDRLRERDWNPNHVQRHHGPDHKTVQKILDGRNVQEGVLDKLATALNKKKIGPPISVLDIPND